MTGRGPWKEIDNAIVRKSAGGFENGANSVRVSLPGDIGGGPVRLQDGDDWVSFALRDARGPGVAAGSRLTYSDVARGVDATYVAQGDGVQELLRLRDASAVRQFVFDLDVSAGLTPVLLESNAIELRDAGGVARLLIAAPVMSDAAGVKSGRLTYELADVGAGWRLTLTASDAWLDDPERRFPVEIDPTITNLYAATRDCSINQSAVDQSFCGADFLKAGGTPGARHRSLLHFDALAALPKGAEVLQGILGLTMTARSTTNPVTLRVDPVTRTWTEAASWNRADGSTPWFSPGGDFVAGSSLGSEIVVASGPGVYGLDVTKLVDSWYEGTTVNRGLMLLSPSGVDNVLTFDSEETNEPGQPLFQVLYTLGDGVQRGHQLETQRLSDRLSLSVNAGNGNLVVRASDLVVPGGLGPDLRVTRTYNSVQGPAGFGVGWRMDSGGDVRLADYGEGNVVLLGPTGYRARYRETTGGLYTTPAGFDNKLAQVAGGGWTLIENASQQKSTFDASGRLVREEDRNGRATRVEYVGSSREVSRIVDSQGRVVTFAYVGGLISRMTDPAGRTYDYEYDGEQRLTDYTDPSGGVTRFEYTAGTFAKLSKITTAGGRVMTIDYHADSGADADRVRSVTRVSSTGSATTSFAYDVRSAGATTKVTDPVGTTTSDPDDRVTTYEFNSDNRVIKTTDALGRNTSQSYDSRANVQEYFAPFNASTTGSLSFNYDAGNGRLDGTTRQTGVGPSLQAAFSYNEAGRVPSGTAGASFLQTSADDEQGNRRFAWYDTRGNPTRDAAMSRDASQTLSDVRFEYVAGSAGKLSATLDGNGNRTTYGYDARGNLTAVSPPLPRGGTIYTYSGAGGADLAISRVTLADLPDGRTQTFAYDALDRVLTITHGDGQVVRVTYDRDGNVTKREDPAHGTTTYAYDELGRLRSESYPGYTNTYTYDRAGNLLTFHDSLHGVVSYAYDEINRQSRVIEPGVSPITVSYANAAADGVDSRVTTTLPNGVRRVEDFDQAGRMKRTCAFATSVSSTCPGSTSQRLQSFSYAYDGGCSTGSGLALLRSVSDERGIQTYYCYDDVGRVRAATAGARTWSYAYDDAGNMLERTDTQDGTFSYAYNAANQLCWRTTGTVSARSCSSPPSGASRHTYDSTGNELTAAGRRGLSVYNARNQQTRVDNPGAPSATRTYAGLGQGERTSTTLAGQPKISLRNSALGLTGAATTAFTRGETGRLIGQRLPTGREYLLDDALGSVRGVTDADGDVIARIDYDPYGQVIQRTGTLTRHGFAGGERDPETNTIHYGQRHYDPHIGRWTQPDPLQQPGDLLQANQYTYVGGNPIGLVDPSGLLACEDLGPFGGACETAGDVVDAGKSAFSSTRSLASRLLRGPGGRCIINGSIYGGVGYAITKDPRFTAAAALVGCTFGLARIGP